MTDEPRRQLSPEERRLKEAELRHLDEKKALLEERLRSMVEMMSTELRRLLGALLLTGSGVAVVFVAAIAVDHDVFHYVLVVYGTALAGVFGYFLAERRVLAEILRNVADESAVPSREREALLAALTRFAESHAPLWPALAAVTGIIGAVVLVVNLLM